MKREEADKIKRAVTPCDTLLLLLYGLFIQDIIINLLVILLVLVIYRYENHVLFRGYDEKRKRKIEEPMKIEEATKETLGEKSLIKG